MILPENLSSLAAAHHLPLSEDLLAYYRQRIEKAEEDYQEAINRVDSLKISHEESHKSVWELHKRTGEIASLQDSVEKSQHDLLEERKQLLRVMAENDALKVQELKDRKKIRYLLSVGASSAEEVTYFRDRLDQRLIKVSRTEIKSGLVGGSGKTSNERDIMIMEDELETLQLSKTAMQSQLVEQRNHYESMLKQLHADRQKRLEEEEARKRVESERISELTKRIEQLREHCRENTKELLRTKKVTHSNERRLVEEKAQLSRELMDIRKSMETERDRIANAENVLTKRINRKQEGVLTDLRKQLGKFESENRVLKSKSEEVEKELKRKIETLSSRCNMLSANYASLKRRRDYEIEGFTNDILLLRKQLKVLEKTILKYGPLEDKELMLLSMAQQTGDKTAKLSTSIEGIKAKVYATENQIRSLVL